MYRIAIVDDEPIVRKGLINLVQWSDLQCEVTCEASDGQELVEYLEYAEVDIVLSDIKMPRMDGLALCSWLHDNRPNIRVVMLTAYSDFEYARQCMKYGVTDYVTKSGGMRDVTTAVQRATMLLEEDRLAHTQLRAEDLYSMQRNFLKNICDGVWSGAEMFDAKEEQLDIRLGTLCVLCLEFDTQESQERIEYLQSSLTDFLTLSFRQYRSWVVPMTKRLFAIVLSAGEAGINTDQIVQITRKVIETLRNMLHTAVFVGMSPIGQGLSELAVSYQKAREALNRRFMDDTSTLYEYQDKTREVPADLNSLNEAMEALFSRVCSGDASDTEQALRHLFDQQKASNIPAEMLKSQALMLNAWCSRLLSEHHIAVENIYDNDISFYKAVTACRSLEEYRRVLTPVILTTCEKIRQASSGASGITQQAHAFIEAHYRENITLADIADHIHINPSYLSRLYKEETGITVMAEVNARKVERAKELLRQPGITVLAAAMEIGIDDPSAFSHFFKKNVGISPRQFQRTLH